MVKLFKAQKKINNVSNCRDIEEAIKISELRYRRLFETAQDGVLLVDFKTGMILDVNPFLIDMLGYSKEDFLKKYLWDVGIFKDVAASKENFLILQQKRYVRFEDLPLKTKKGESVNVEFVANAYEVGDEMIIQCNVRDISDRKKIEKNLSALISRQKTILAAIPDIIMEVDNNKIYQWANQAGLNFFGEDVIGKSADFYFEGKQDVYDIVKPIFEGSDDLVYLESWQRRKDGQKRLLAWWCQSFKDINGKVMGAISSARDITDNKQTQMLLAENEQKLKSIFDNSPIAKFVIDKNHNISYWNKALEKLTGFTAKQMIGTNNQWQAFYKEKRVCLADLLVDGLIEDIPELYYGRYSKSKLLKDSYEVVDFFPNMSRGEKWLRFTSAPIRDLGGNIIGAEETLEDVTESKRMEQKIINDKLKDEAILSSIGDAVMACNERGEIMIFNKGAEDLTGYLFDDINGHHYSEVVNLISEKNGVAVDYIKEAIAEKKIINVTNHVLLIKKNGEKIPISKSIAPIIDIDGNVIGCVGIFRDITQERKIDRAKTEFVSLASHQLRTPLSVVKWYIETLLSEDIGKLNEKQKKYCDEILKSNSHIIDLVNSLLNLSRLELGVFMIQPEIIDVSLAVKGVIDEQMRQINYKKINFIENCAQDLPKINVDLKLLHIILQNILDNAIKYTQEGGKINFEIVLSDDKGKEIKNKSKASHILFKVSDNGFGIPLRQQNRVFEKFFRADNVQDKNLEGTGLGLYIVKQITDYSGASIWYESEENKGTTFYLALPLEGMKKKEGTKTLI